MANTADILAAIDRCCAKNHHQVTYLSTQPLLFRLDGTEAYRAEVLFGWGRFLSGYYIKCIQVID